MFDVKLLLLHSNTWNHFTFCKLLIVNKIIRIGLQYLEPFNCVQKNEARLKMLSTKCVYKSHIINICI